MEYLLSIAAKSLLIAGGTLLLLKVMHRRSSSDRSWVAHLGLLAEQYDPRARRMLGNFPQAFSHVALVNTARILTGDSA